MTIEVFERQFFPEIANSRFLFAEWRRPDKDGGRYQEGSPSLFGARLREARAEGWTLLRCCQRRLDDGKYVPDYFPIDLDADGDLARVFRDARRLIAYFSNAGVQKYWALVMFSGRKGLAILLPAAVFCPRPGTKEEWEAAATLVARRLASKLDLQTVDLTAYREKQLIRWANVIHQDTQAFRIPLHPNELFKLPEEIVRLARLGRRLFEVEPEDVDPQPCEPLVEVFREAIETVRDRDEDHSLAGGRCQANGGTQENLSEATRCLREALPFSTTVSQAKGRAPILVIDGPCPACLSRPESQVGAEPGKAWITDRTHRLKCHRAKCRACPDRTHEKGLKPQEWISEFAPEAYQCARIELRRAAPVAKPWAEAKLPSCSPCLGVRAAREILVTRLKEAVLEAHKGLTLIESTPGTGKTVGAALVVQESIANGKLNGKRVMFVLDTHEQIRELLCREELAKLQAVAKIWHGRGKQNCQDCLSGALSKQFGRRRKQVRAYCEGGGAFSCPHRDNCATTGYLHNVEVCNKAQCVFTTKATLQAGGDVVDSFDILVVDESLEECLVEKVLIDAPVVHDWKRAYLNMPNGGRARPSVGRWLGLLEAVVARHLPKPYGEAQRFLAAMLEEASTGGENLPSLVDEIERELEDSTHRVPWEQDFHAGQEKVIPLRATRELVRLLTTEIRGPASPDGSFAMTPSGIAMRVVRTDLIKSVGRRTCVNLDGTPCLPVLKLVFPKLRHVHVVAREHVRVTQITDNLFPVATVRKVRPKIKDLIEARSAHEPHPVVFSWKEFDPNCSDDPANSLKVLCPGAKYGHLGAHLRSVNKFEEASSITIVGHLVLNVGEAEARFRALRFQLGRPAPPPVAEEQLLPYQYEGPNGERFARGCRGGDDPEVAAYLDWCWTSNILQAVARGRPAARTAANPLPVLLLCAKPVRGMPVDRLTTFDDLLKENGLGHSELDPGRAALIVSNEGRRKAHDESVGRAVQELIARGEKPTAKAVMRKLGRSDGGKQRATVQAALARRNQPLQVPPSAYEDSKVPGGTKTNADSVEGLVTRSAPCETPAELPHLTVITSDEHSTSKAGVWHAPGADILPTIMTTGARRRVGMAQWRESYEENSPAHWSERLSPEERESMLELRGMLLDSHEPPLVASLAALATVRGTDPEEALRRARLAAGLG